MTIFPKLAPPFVVAEGTSRPQQYVIFLPPFFQRTFFFPGSIILGNRLASSRFVAFLKTDLLFFSSPFIADRLDRIVYLLLQGFNRLSRALLSLSLHHSFLISLFRARHD